MHDIVIEEFDQYLRGEASSAFHAHLEVCESCRTEVSSMTELTLLFSDFRPDSEAVEPPPGFYNGVANRIVEKKRFGIWGFSSAGSGFFRRMAFASLLLLAGLGSFLISREAEEGGADAVAIMAQHDATSAHSEVADRDRLLVTLATYR